MNSNGPIRFQLSRLLAIHPRKSIRRLMAIAGSLVLAAGMLGSGWNTGEAANSSLVSQAGQGTGGFYSLAVGVKYQDFDDLEHVGEVDLFHGSLSGLFNPGGQRWYQGRDGTPADDPKSGEHYGVALVSGDFDGDGYYDLAIGVQDDKITDSIEPGAVHVLYGTESGLLAERSQLWYQGSQGIEEEPENYDRFGAALSSGDYNGDGFDDLAVGAPEEDLADVRVGCVHVIYGSVLGLQAEGNQVWFQGELSGLQDQPEEEDRFGKELASGDFDHDGFDDLAIGVPNEDLEQREQVAIEDAGIVQVLYGGGGGLESSGNQLWHEDMLGGNGAGPGHNFGYALAAGDFDQNQYTDLAIGAPGALRMDLPGAVHIIFADSGGLDESSFIYLDQDQTPDDPSEPNDLFGYTLASGYFNDDGYADLAVGVVGESLGTELLCGAVQIVYGTYDGIFVRPGDFFYQGLGGIPDVAETGDYFGYALTSGDFNWDGIHDLAVGSIGEDLEVEIGPLQSDAGAVNVLFGTPSGIHADGNQFLTQDLHDGEINAGDAFGYALAALPGTVHHTFLGIIFR